MRIQLMVYANKIGIAVIREKVFKNRIFQVEIPVLYEKQSLQQ